MDGVNKSGESVLSVRLDGDDMQKKYIHLYHSRYLKIIIFS